MTSYDDVTSSDFSQTFRKVLFYQYLTSVWIWSYFNHFWPKYDHFGVIVLSMGFPIFSLPLFGKTAVTSVLGIDMTQNVQKNVKLNFRHIKIVAGLRPAPIFRFFKFSSRGGSFTPPLPHILKIWKIGAGRRPATIFLCL